MLGVAGVFGGSLFSAMHGSLVTSSLIRETTENESANEVYRFGQEEETYNIVAAHGYFALELRRGSRSTYSVFWFVLLGSYLALASLFLSLLLAVLVWKKENEEDDISRVFGNNLLRNGKAFV
jgi:hypothetical protein